MSLTRLDCHFYRGPHASFEQSSYVALNPRCSPGSLVFAAAAAVRESIGSQVACRLAMEHFVDGVLEYFGRKRECGTDPQAGKGQTEISLEVLENAFRRANSSVYSFGHKLAAGGRMAASLLGLVIEGRTIAAGKVGQGAAYLYRRGQLFPFFDEDDNENGHEELEQNFIGTNSLVSVELASVPTGEGDLVFAFSAPLSDQKKGGLVELIESIEFSGPNPCALLARRLFIEQELAFAMLTRLGPETIYLEQRAVTYPNKALVS